MVNLNYISNVFKGKKNKIKIISATILTLFLIQAVTMTNISDNNKLSDINNIDNDLLAPIENLPDHDIEILEIEEFIDNENTNEIVNIENKNPIPSVDSNEAFFSKISSYQGNDLNTDIRAKETFTAENSVNDLILQNSFDDSYNIQTSTALILPDGDYINTDHTIIVENTRASVNYNHIEYENSNYRWLDSSTNLWQSVATSFEVTESAVNITQVRLAYLKFDSGNLQGEAYITNIVSGKPGTTKIGGQAVDLTLGGGTNTTLTFPQPVTLTMGSYAIVLNETSPEDDENIFRYKYVRDDGYGDMNDETQMWQKSWGGSWASVSRDLFFSYEYLALNPADYSKPKLYSSPVEVNLLYSLNVNSIDFTSDAPVTFDLVYRFDYESNPLQVLTDFTVDNQSLPTWLSSFTHQSLPSGTYTINSRNLTIFNIPLDWKAIEVDQNANIFSLDPDNDLNIIYTNGTAELTVLLGEDTNSYTWATQFVSPNYINSLTLKENDLNILNSPYKITNPNTLRIIANMDTPDPNSNGSLFIYDTSDMLNFYESNVIINSNTLTYSIWDPSVTLDLNEDNSGIYSVVTYWIDSSLTKIGYFETTFELMTQTDLSAYTDSSSYSNSEIIHLTADFSSSLNGTILDTAEITYVTGWDATTGVLTQSQSHGLYTADISVINAPIGSTSLSVYAQLEGYEGQSVLVPITITLEETLLEYSVNGTDVSNLDLNYHEIISFSIQYTSWNDPIFSATVEVNGTLATEELDGSYTFIFDTASIIPYTSSFMLIVHASKPSYLSKDLTINFNMEEANTDIVPLGDTPNNNSQIAKYYSYSSSDLIELQLKYQGTVHGETIKNALVSHNASVSDFSVSLSEDLNNIWIIELNPETPGLFTIEFSFDLLAYQQLTYVITFQIDGTPTSVVQDGHPDFLGIDSTIHFSFNPDSYQPLVLFVTYYDSVYNEILKDGSIAVWSDGINVSILVDQFENGTFSIQFNPLGSGLENVTIQFDQANYHSSTLSVTLELEEIIENHDDTEKFCDFIYRKGKKKLKLKIKKRLCKILDKIFEHIKDHKGWLKHSPDKNKYYYSEYSKATPYIHKVINQCMKHRYL